MLSHRNDGQPWIEVEYGDVQRANCPLPDGRYVPEAEVERLRDSNLGWSEEVNRIEGELRGAIAEGLDYRKALEEILDDVRRTPEHLRSRALADRVAQRAQFALWTAGDD